MIETASSPTIELPDNLIRSLESFFPPKEGVTSRERIRGIINSAQTGVSQLVEFFRTGTLSNDATINFSTDRVGLAFVLGSILRKLGTHPNGEGPMERPAMATALYLTWLREAQRDGQAPYDATDEIVAGLLHSGLTDLRALVQRKRDLLVRDIWSVVEDVIPSLEKVLGVQRTGNMRARVAQLLSKCGNAVNVDEIYHLTLQAVENSGSLTDSLAQHELSWREKVVPKDRMTHKREHFCELLEIGLQQGDWRPALLYLSYVLHGFEQRVQRYSEDGKALRLQMAWQAYVPFLQAAGMDWTSQGLEDALYRLLLGKDTYQVYKGATDTAEHVVSGQVRELQTEILESVSISEEVCTIRFQLTGSWISRFLKDRQLDPFSEEALRLLNQRETVAAFSRFVMANSPVELVVEKDDPNVRAQIGNDFSSTETEIVVLAPSENRARLHGRLAPASSGLPHQFVVDQKTVQEIITTLRTTPPLAHRIFTVAKSQLQRRNIRARRPRRGLKAAL